jgi:hypothetical protein
MSLPPEPDWSQAACKGQGDAMFPTETNRHAVQHAKSFCRVCPLVAECRAYSLAYDALHTDVSKRLWGVWGQLTRAERRVLRQNRSAA